MSVFIGVFPKGKEEDSPIPGSTDVTIQDSSASFQFEPTGESPAQVLVIPSRSRKGHHPGISAFTTKLFGSVPEPTPRMVAVKNKIAAAQE